MTVSIIIPIHNARESLPATLCSVLNQNHRELEILLIDDASTDGSGQLCDRLAETDRRISVVHFAVRGGVSRARNWGLSHATGTWVMFVDADDEFFGEDVVRTFVANARNQDVDIVIGSHVVERFGQTQVVETKSDGCIVDAKTFLRSEEGARLTLKHGYCWARLYRRRFLIAGKVRFDTRLSVGEDCFFNLASIKAHARILLVRDIVYRYKVEGDRFRPGRVWRLQDLQKLFEDFARECESNCVDPDPLYARLHVNQTIVYFYQHCHLCRTIHGLSIFTLARELLQIVNCPLLQHSLTTYRREKWNESVTAPFLMKRRATLLLTVYCLLKGKKLYA